MIKNQYFKTINSFQNHLESINYKYLNIVSINLRSISSLNKFNKFKTFLSNLPRLPDILAIQETWFQEKVSDMYKIPHYNSVHCCRGDGYGGTSIYIANKFQFTVDCCESFNYVDLIQIRLNNIKVNGKQLEFMTYYRSQKCKIEEFLNVLENKLINIPNSPLVVVGDSNVDLIEGVSEDLTNLFHCFSLNNCHTLVTRPQSGTCIDHIFSNLVDQIAIDSVECSLTDHNLICCKLRLDIEELNFLESVKITCDYAKVKNYLEQNLLNINNLQNPSDATACLLKVMNDAILSNSNQSIEKKNV